MSIKTFALASLLLSMSCAPLAAQNLVQTPAPGASGGVFVEQIGDRNSATFDQSSNAQNAELSQDGNDNVSDIAQNDGGAHFASLDQIGNENVATVTQSGEAQNVAILSQNGDSNIALLTQNNPGVLGSAAAIAQNGSGNSAILEQNGSDNQAVLAQNGDNNTMSASQIGDGNRLEWIQNGNGLPDMTVIQSGGAAAQITQTN